MEPQHRHNDPATPARRITDQLRNRARSFSQAAVLEMIADEVVAIPFALGAESRAVLALVRCYANVPMSLTDACLVRMLELVGGGVVLTLDGDFRIYRRHGRQRIPVVMPGGK